MAFPLRLFSFAAVCFAALMLCDVRAKCNSNCVQNIKKCCNNMKCRAKYCNARCEIKTMLQLFCWKFIKTTHLEPMSHMHTHAGNIELPAMCTDFRGEAVHRVKTKNYASKHLEHALAVTVTHHLYFFGGLALHHRCLALCAALHCND